MCVCVCVCVCVCACYGFSVKLCMSISTTYMLFYLSVVLLLPIASEQTGSDQGTANAAVSILFQ